MELVDLILGKLVYVRLAACPVCPACLPACLP